MIEPHAAIDPAERVLDVRDEAAFAAGHLEGSGHLPLENLAERRHELPDRHTALAVVDERPERAERAAAALRDLGFARARAVAVPLAELPGGTASRAAAVPLWRPAPFLAEALHLLPRGRAADVAAGAGREATFLALHGFDVEAWDHDPEALARAAALAARHGGSIRTVVADLEAPGAALPERAYTAIVCFRFLHRPLFPALERALAPGGVLAIETFRRGQERFGKPRRPRFLLEPGELASAFPSLETLRSEEPSPPGGPWTARLVARRPAGFRRPVVAAALAIALLAAAAPPITAHEFWLSPSTLRPAAGDTVAIAACVGTGFRGERRPFAPSRARRFEARGAGRTDLRGTAREADTIWARIAADGGGTLVAYESDFARIEIPAAEFDDYLREEGLEAPLALRARLGPAAGPGRERYARCPKTWIAGAQPDRALAEIGLPLEIVPRRDPGAPGPLEVRVLFRGRPLAGARVRAWRQPLDAGGAPLDPAARDSVEPAAEARTDRRGLAALAAAGDGEWLVSVVHMVPCARRAVADWESYWASLTFARRSGAP